MMILWIIVENFYNFFYGSNFLERKLYLPVVTDVGLDTVTLLERRLYLPVVTGEKATSPFRDFLTGFSIIYNIHYQ